MTGRYVRPHSPLPQKAKPGHKTCEQVRTGLHSQIKAPTQKEERHAHPEESRHRHPEEPVEVTVHNRSEVVEYLQQCNWHLDRENFVRVAPDEYCLVSKSVLTPGMDIVSERTVYEWGIIMTKKKSHTEHSVQLAIWQYFRREMLRLALIGIPLLYCGLLIVLFVIDCARALIHLICG